MRIKVWSDLHMEFGNTVFDIAEESFDDCDVVVIAGDISAGNVLYFDYLDVCEVAFKNPNTQFILVPGNHEYYYKTILDTELFLENIISRPEYDNIHLLNQDVVEIDGITFAGCVGWCDLSYGGIFNPAYVSDFRLIKNFDWNRCEKLGLEDRFFLDHTKADVYITHNGPTSKSIHEKYNGSPINSYFSNDYSSIIEKNEPKLWIHGHTHCNMDYRYNSTRVVCNPFGYPGENKEFDKNFVVEVSSGV
jgi:Icc-related predicted phosphoesterase